MKAMLRRIWSALLGLTLLAACTSALPMPAPTSTPPLDPAPTTIPNTPTATPTPLAALVNGEPISLAEYERQIARYEASMTASGQDPGTAEGQAELAQGREWVLDLMIEQRLIAQAARESGMTVSVAEVDAAIVSLRAEIGEEAFQQWLTHEQMTLEEMHAQLHNDMLATKMANQIAEAVPAVAEHVHARHILLPTEQEARQVLGQLQAGGDFVALAQAHSRDGSTSIAGGDLGYFPRGVLTSPAVEAVAFALEPGQVSDVVASELGFHVIQLVARAPEMAVEPENLRLLRDKAVREWLVGLHAVAHIERFVSPPTE